MTPEDRLARMLHAEAAGYQPGDGRDGIQRRLRARRRARTARMVALPVVAAGVAAAILVPLLSANHSTGSSVVVTGPPSTITVPRPTLGSTAPAASVSATTVPATTVPSTTVPVTTTLPPLTAPAGTDVRTFEAFTASGAVNPALVVTKTVSGSCVNTGVAGGASYRCFAKNGEIYDPCFARPGATSGLVVCPTDPATPDVVDMQTTSLPTPGQGPYGPWAVELKGGPVCMKVDAAWGGLGPFGCQSPLLADCHTPTEGSPSWTADCQAQGNDKNPFRPYHVEVVWL